MPFLAKLSCGHTFSYYTLMPKMLSLAIAWHKVLLMAWWTGIRTGVSVEVGGGSLSADDARG